MRVEAGTIMHDDQGVPHTVDDEHAIFRDGKLYVTETIWEALKAKAVPIEDLEWKPFPMAESYRRVLQDQFDEDEDRLEAFDRLYRAQWPERP